MYPPPIYAVDEAETRAMLERVGLGALVSQGAEGFQITHMPFVFDAAAGALVGHLSRGNPHAQSRPGEAVVIFQDLGAYVSPSLYPSKQIHHRVAPTWNYEALHVHGRVEWIEDEAWLLDNLNRLTDRFEAGRDPPWRVADAPEDFTAMLLPRIVGVRVHLDRVEARRKLSQEKKPADRQGVIDGLAGSADLAAQRVAQAMRTLEA